MAALVLGVKNLNLPYGVGALLQISCPGLYVEVDFCELVVEEGGNTGGNIGIGTVVTATGTDGVGVAIGVGEAGGVSTIISLF